MPLPAQLSPDRIDARLADLSRDDAEAHEVLGHGFVGTPGAQACAVRALIDRLGANGLDPGLFPSALRLESELIGITSSHLGGPTPGVGSFTSGGTESVMLAVKAARDDACVPQPRMVVPATAHPCFHKAGAFLGVAVDVVPVHPDTLAADPAATAARITDDTILLVGSAPSYPHGVVDPIGALGELARARGIRLHVDACMGGWILPLWRQLGVPLAPFDLSVPGVSSLSVDLHKYGLCPKGASMVLYREAHLRRAQLFTFSGWPGYPMVNPTVQSSRSVGPMAAAWAAIHAHGAEGYLALAQQLLDATRQLRDALAAIPGLAIVGPAQVQAPLFAVASERVSAARLADQLATLGVRAYPQPGLGRAAPAAVHVTVVPPLLSELDRIAAAFSEAQRRAVEAPTPPLVQRASELDLAELDDDALEGLVSQLLPADDGAPAAGISEVLLALPPPQADRLLRAWAQVAYRGPSPQAAR